MIVLPAAQPADRRSDRGRHARPRRTRGCRRARPPSASSWPPSAAARSSASSRPRSCRAPRPSRFGTVAIAAIALAGLVVAAMGSVFTPRSSRGRHRPSPGRASASATCSTITWVQRRIPPDLMGRVMSLLITRLARARARLDVRRRRRRSGQPEGTMLGAGLRDGHPGCPVAALTGGSEPRTRAARAVGGRRPSGRRRGCNRSLAGASSDLSRRASGCGCRALARPRSHARSPRRRGAGRPSPGRS